MITATILIASLALGAGFVVAWLLRPEMRAWVERPKHTSQAHVQRYDRTSSAGSWRHRSR